MPVFDAVAVVRVVGIIIIPRTPPAPPSQLPVHSPSAYGGTITTVTIVVVRFF